MIIARKANIEVRLAQNNDEIRAAYKLRYEYLIKDYNPLQKNKTGLDYTLVDDKADLLVAIDVKINKVVGTYRLIRDYNLFTSHNEYNLEVFKGKKVVEVSRAVVDPAYRDGVTIKLLWQGIMQYLAYFDIEYMLGTASFHGTKRHLYYHGLSYLYYHYLVDTEITAQAPSFSLKLMEEEQINIQQAKAELPALIKGYLRLGAKFASEAYIDYEFNSIDVLVVLNILTIDKRYYRYLMGGEKC